MDIIPKKNKTQIAYKNNRKGTPDLVIIGKTLKIYRSEIRSFLESPPHIGLKIISNIRSSKKAPLINIDIRFNYHTHQRKYTYKDF